MQSFHCQGIRSFNHFFDNVHVLQLEISMEDLADVRVLDGLVYIESTNRRLRESSYNPRELYDVDIRNLLRSECRLSKADRQLVSNASDTAITGECQWSDGFCQKVLCSVQIQG